MKGWIKFLQYWDEIFHLQIPSPEEAPFDNEQLNRLWAKCNALQLKIERVERVEDLRYAEVTTEVTTMNMDNLAAMKRESEMRDRQYAIRLESVEQRLQGRIETLRNLYTAMRRQFGFPHPDTKPQSYFTKRARKGLSNSPMASALAGREKLARERKNKARRVAKKAPRKSGHNRVSTRSTRRRS